MTDVYDRFDKAFPNIGAYTIHRDGQCVGRLAFKHGASCRAFLQVWGAPMAEGRANGYGYDKMTAAVEQAARKLSPIDRDGIKDATTEATMDTLKRAISEGPEGQRWQHRLEEAGFTVNHVFG